MISGENKNSSDVRSLIEQLMKSKDAKINHFSLPRVSQPVLMQTEEKIFQEVVNLLEEIQELKNQISTEKDETFKLEAERDQLKKDKNLVSSKRRLDDFDM